MNMAGPTRKLALTCTVYLDIVLVHLLDEVYAFLKHNLAQLATIVYCDGDHVRDGCQLLARPTVFLVIARTHYYTDMPPPA